MEGLDTYAATMQKQAGEELRWKQIKAMLVKARGVREGLVRLPIEYAYSPLGRALREAGHVTGSREYAIGVDPFKGWPKHLRGAAFHDMGWECDDAAAYQERGACPQLGDGLIRKQELGGSTGCGESGREGGGVGTIGVWVGTVMVNGGA